MSAVDVGLRRLTDKATALRRRFSQARLDGGTAQGSQRRSPAEPVRSKRAGGAGVRPADAPRRDPENVHLTLPRSLQ